MIFNSPLNSNNISPVLPLSTFGAVILVAPSIPVLFSLELASTSEAMKRVHLASLQSDASKPKFRVLLHRSSGRFFLLAE
jgi:hypothetical protein